MLRSGVIGSIIGAQGRQAIANLRTARKRVENGASVGVLGIAPSPYRRVIPILQPFVIVLDLFTVIDFHDWFLRSLRDGGRIVRDGKKKSNWRSKERESRGWKKV